MKNYVLMLALCAATGFAQTPIGCGAEPIIYRVNGTKVRVTVADLSLDAATATLTHLDGFAQAKTLTLLRPATGGAVLAEGAFDDFPTGDYAITVTGKLPGCVAVGLSHPVVARIPATSKNLWAILHADDYGIWATFPPYGVIAGGKGTALFQNLEQDNSVSVPFALFGSEYQELFKSSDPEAYGYVSAVVPLKLVAGGPPVNVATAAVQYYYDPANFDSSSSANALVKRPRSLKTIKLRPGFAPRVRKDEAKDIIE